jgi:hypothetical protein
MRFLLLLVSLLIAVLSMGWTVGVAGHLVLVIPAALMLWFLDVTTRPMVPCRFCDKGRTWDSAHEHFGEFCAGGPLGIGSCGGVGKKLRWEARVLRMVGAGGQLRNLPDVMRGGEDG